MESNSNKLAALLGLLSFLFLAMPDVALAADYLSPQDLIADKQGQNLFIAQATANRLAVFSIADGKVVKTVPLGDPPAGLALSPDGATLYVTGASPEGKVFVVDVAAGQIQKTLLAGHTPVAVAVAPDGKTLYVCNKFNHNVSVLDVASGRQTAQIAVTRQPIAAVLTPDGKFLFVANLLPAGSAIDGYTAAVVSVIDTAASRVVASIELPNGSTSLRGMCISPDGTHIYVTHILGRYQLPTTQVDRGWINTNAMTVIDVAARKALGTVLLDELDLGAANPWGVACSADGRWVVVAHAGTHELSVIDQPALLDRLAKAATVQAAGADYGGAAFIPVQNDLAFLVGIRRRVPLQGVGPRGLALVGAKAYAAEYFSDSLGVVDVDPDGSPGAQSIELGPRREPSAARLGERLFHDATLCFQQWQSCSTCHPDTRVDGLDWDLLNDDLGNPKSTKNLLLAHKTPPAMSTGIRASAELAVRSGIRHILFEVRQESEAAAIDEYLKSLRPVPSPRLVGGKLSESAQRGRKFFEQAGCAGCHTPPLGTDLHLHNVGTGIDRDVDRAFDTPTLIEVWRTGPYLHDGRAATMKEVLTQFNAGDRHGKTSKLSEQDLGDLVEYVLSL